MTGPAVTQLQQRLAALRYYPGPVDGQLGIAAFLHTLVPTPGTPVYIRG